MFNTEYLKNFANEFTKSAQLAGIYPQNNTYQRIFRNFDYELFASNSKVFKSDDISISLYKMLFLSCVFLLDGSKYSKDIIDFGIKYCNANDIMLNELFGDFKKDVISIKESQIEWVDSDFCVLFGKLYELFPPGFHTNWCLSHFESIDCIRYKDSFLVVEDFFGLNEMSNIFKMRIGITDELDNYLAIKSGYIPLNDLNFEIGDFE